MIVYLEVFFFPTQERVNLARGIEKIEFHNCREKQHNSWFKQAAEALEVDLDDDLLLGKARITLLMKVRSVTIGKFR